MGHLLVRPLDWDRLPADFSCVRVAGANPPPHNAQPVLGAQAPGIVALKYEQFESTCTSAVSPQAALAWASQWRPLGFSGRAGGRSPVRHPPRIRACAAGKR